MDETTPQQLDQRVAAIEHILDTVLPMLIQGSPHHEHIRQELLEMETAPPSRMQGNEALPILVNVLLEALPELGAPPE